MKNQHYSTSLDENAKKVMLDKRLEDFGWGALLVVMAQFGCCPKSRSPEVVG